MFNTFYPKIVPFMRYVGKCMRFASWIAKATNTHREYVIFTTFQWRQLLPERAAMLHYTCIPVLIVLRMLKSTRLHAGII